MRTVGQPQPGRGGKPRDLYARSEAFALASLAFFRLLPKTTEAQAPGKQFLEASSSVRANYRAARRSRSRREFIAKLGVVVEEIDECVGWLDYMKRGRIGTDPDLVAEASELCAIFTRALQTARKNGPLGP